MSPEELRQSIGLPAEATDDEVRAKIAELQGNAQPGQQQSEQVQPTAEPSAQNVDKGGEPTPGAAPTGAPAQPANQPTPGSSPGPAEGETGGEASEGGVTASADGTVTVPASVWASVQSGAQQGSQVYAREMERDKTATIDEALKQGKIAAAMKGQMETLWDKDPKGIKHLLTASVEQGGLAENLIPVAARGEAPAGEELAATEDAYPSEWLGQSERARIAAASAGARPGTTTSAGKD